MKFELALQTPSVILPIVPQDCLGKKDNFGAEFKRYNVEDAQQKFKDFKALFNTNDDLTEEQLEALTDTELADIEAQASEIAEKVKVFVKNEVLSFRDVKCYLKGKLVKAIKNTEEAGDDLDNWGGAANCTNAWFDHFWSSMPYRDAIRNALFDALRNTPRN